MGPPPGESYYQILNVPHDATQKEISRSYRRLAKILHPDVCESPEADELFKAINEAYQVLRDPKKREDYDTTLAVADFSDYRDYYEGVKRYRDPRTWYYAHHHPRPKTHRTPEAAPFSSYQGNQPRGYKIPRSMQVLLFYLTLLMGVVIISQLLVIPWINGVNASDARIAYDAGNRWMQEHEFKKAIESYSDAVNKNSTFIEGWKGKGTAEFRKAQELQEIGMNDGANEYYISSVKSLNEVYKQNPWDAEVISLIGSSLFAIGEYERASRYLRQAHEIKPNDSDIEKRMLEADKRLLLTVGGQRRG